MAAATIDEYLAGLEDERRERLTAIRDAARAGAPEATETIAYGLPALRSHGGRFLVSFDAYRQHESLFPASDAVIEGIGDELTRYLHGSGTIRFPRDEPVPTDLIRRIVEIRWSENAAAGGR
jgi:uncharacterized protein YdhG (YjbR/CyaY superfamily)